MHVEVRPISSLPPDDELAGEIAAAQGMMFYPKERSAASTLKALLLKGWEENGKQFTSDSNSLVSSVKALLAKKVNSGVSAGYVAENMIKMHLAGIVPDLNKACFVSKMQREEFGRQFIHLGTGKRGVAIPVDRKKLAQRFRDHKNVAHYWLTGMYSTTNNDSRMAVWHDLCMAEAFRLLLLELPEIEAEGWGMRPCGIADCKYSMSLSLSEKSKEFILNVLSGYTNPNYE